MNVKHYTNFLNFLKNGSTRKYKSSLFTHLEIGTILKPIEQNRNMLKIRKAKRKKHIIIIADLPTQAPVFLRASERGQ
jgi:hypothetical protein